MEFLESLIKIIIWFLVILLSVYGGFWIALTNAWQGVPTWAYVLLIIAFILLEFAFVFRKKRKVMKVLLCASILLGGIGGIRKAIYHYDQNIPKVTNDDDAILFKYQPFTEEYEGITLNSSLKLTENLPRIDGATAFYPIYASFVHNVYPEGIYESWNYESEESKLEGEESLVVCSKTPNAYQRLIDGKTDLIFVLAPSEKQVEAARKAGVEFEMTPIGKEAFVFFVNSKNPVNELTLDQIRKIYSGEITNWNEVGGKNESIKPFQRPEGSGSQSALLRLMGDLKLIEPLEEDVLMGMGAIIRQTADYKNYKNAIGYSFRYYSTELVQNNQIKLLTVDGIEPTKQNIQNNTYPINNDFYAITLKGHDNPNIDLFIDWIVGSQGQQIIDEIGYVSYDSK